MSLRNLALNFLTGLSLSSAASLVYAQPCTIVLRPGADASVSAARVVQAVSTAAAAATVCLEPGDYGFVLFKDVHKPAYVTLRSTVASGARIALALENSAFIRLEGLSISSLEMWHASLLNRHIQVVGNVFTGQALVRGSGADTARPADILISGNRFNGITVCDKCHEGRLQLANAGGVTVSNNQFADGGDADGIQVSGYGGIIGPDNIFKGLHYRGRRHVDAIQLYGGPPENVEIFGNFFQDNATAIMAPDGASKIFIYDNVFVGTGANRGEIQLGSHRDGIFRRNTVIGMAAGFNAKPGEEASTRQIVQDNLFLGRARLDINCVRCDIKKNGFDRTSVPTGTCWQQITYTGRPDMQTWKLYRADRMFKNDPQRHECKRRPASAE